VACIRAIISSLGRVLCPPIQSSNGHILGASQPCAWSSVKYRVINRCKSYTIAWQTESDGQCLSAVVVTRTASNDCSPDHDRISMGFLDARVPPTARRWGHEMTNGWWGRSELGLSYLRCCLQDFDVLRDTLCTSFSCWLRQISWHSCEGFSSEVIRPLLSYVRRHALHDINFCHWAHGRDNSALCFAKFGKPYDMTRGQVCYAMQGRSVSRTRFTVMFQ